MLCLLSTWPTSGHLSALIAKTLVRQSAASTHLAEVPSAARSWEAPFRSAKHADVNTPMMIAD